MHPLLMGSLSWIEYRQRLQDPQTTVIIPCGALEQHGPHLPLGTDALLSTSIAQSVAEQVNGIVAPTFSYGYKSQPKSGVLSSAKTASVEKGRLMATQVAESIAAAIRTSFICAVGSVLEINYISNPV